MASVAVNAAGRSDPLREGLALLCRQLGADTSVDELGYGFALEQGRLPLDLVPRALRRARVEGRVLALSLERLGARLLPVLLLLEDGGTVVLVEWDGDEAVVLLPESGSGARRMRREELAASYAGMAVVARPAYEADRRAGDFARELGEHWLKGPLKRHWRTWLETGIAALVANVLAISTAIFAMQVYDRVVPTGAHDTLWILASGVALAVVLEFVLRSVRAHLLDATGKALDLQLSSLLFERVLQDRKSVV